MSSDMEYEGALNKTLIAKWRSECSTRCLVAELSAKRLRSDEPDEDERI